MSSAIARSTMTDDSGAGTDGTIFNNAWLQDIYDRIDAMFAGGGAYTTFTFGGNVQIPSADGVYWGTRSIIFSPAASVLKLSDPTAATGVRLNFTTTDQLVLQNFAGSDRGDFFARLADFAKTQNANSVHNFSNASTGGSSSTTIKATAGTCVVNVDAVHGGNGQLGTSSSHPLMLYTAGVQAVILDTSQNATFAGNVRCPTFRCDDNVSGPVTSIGTPTGYYGTTGTFYLSQPDIWLRINVDGADYKFAGYS